MKLENASVSITEGRLLVERDQLTRRKVLSDDGPFVMFVIIFAAAAWLIGSSIAGGWDEYDSWKGHLFLAIIGAAYVIAVRIEKRRLGWTLFTDTRVVRIAWDSGWNWVPEELECDEQLSIWVTKGLPRGHVLCVTNGTAITIMLRSDLTFDKLSEVAALLAKTLDLVPDETRPLMWNRGG